MREETLEPLVYLTTKLRSLNGKLTLDQAKRLAALPRELGFANAEEFLTAFRKAIGADSSVESGVAGVSEDDDSSVAEGSDVEVGDSLEPTGGANVSEARLDDRRSERLETEREEDVAEDSPLSEKFEEKKVQTAAASSKADGSEATDVDLPAQVKSLVEAGKTRAAIAEELGISITHVQKIRKTLGLGRSSAKPKTGATSAKKRRRGHGGSDVGR